MRRAFGWPLIIAVSAIGVGLAVLIDLGPPIRPLVAFWFLLVCPGMAFVRLLDIDEWITEWTMAIALSLALDALVAAIMVVTKTWSPAWALFVLIWVSLTGAVLQLVRYIPRSGGAPRRR